MASKSVRYPPKLAAYMPECAETNAQIASAHSTVDPPAGEVVGLKAGIILRFAETSRPVATKTIAMAHSDF